MSTALGLLFVAAGYLAGSVAFGPVVARLFGAPDPRTVGSGNIGASNVTRAAGPRAGALTLLLDAAKAAVPMLLARWLVARAGGSAGAADAWSAAAGLAAFAGHLWPVWTRFQGGGKGVATGFGVFLVLAPMPALLALAAFAIAFAATRIPAVGSLTGTAVCAVGTFLVHGGASAIPWAGLVVTGFVLWRHRGNIKRLLEGGENKA